jgi:hypothetical protein
LEGVQNRCPPQKLDLVVFYLAQVHWYEYYSGMQHDSVGELLDNWRPYTRPQYEPESLSGDVDTAPRGGGSDGAVPDGDAPLISASESDGEEDEEKHEEEAEEGGKAASCSLLV